MSGPAQQAPEPRIVNGIDVSHHQGEIRWLSVAEASIALAAVKVTEGADYADPRGRENIAGARAVGLDVVAYHFLSQDSTPERQARWFLEQLGGDPAALAPLRLALDVEDRDDRPLWGSVVGPIALRWLQIIEVATGIAPWVYLSPAFAARTHLADVPDLARFPLWIAHWGAREPTLPAPWRDWIMWQTGKGRVPGIVGDVDLDRVRL